MTAANEQRMALMMLEILSSQFISSSFSHKVAAPGEDSHVRVHDALALVHGFNLVPELLFVTHVNVLILRPRTLRMTVTLEVRMNTDVVGSAAEVIRI